MLWVLLQVNGHQIMDEPMEEGESFSHCVSNNRHDILEHIPAVLHASFFLNAGCLCRMKGPIRRSLSLTM